MLQTAQDSYRFDLGRSQYLHIRVISWLFLVTLILVSTVCIGAGIMFWHTYTHTFTPYLKWQDALLALTWFVAFICAGGSILTTRFLFALHAGYKHGMVIVEGEQAITARDLSSKNLPSIFWIMNSAFWCFLAVLIGLAPLILIGWTIHLPNPLLATFCTVIASALSLLGLGVSIVAASFIMIGIVGAVSFCRNLGGAQRYPLSGKASISIDDFVLTITFPSYPESMIDLNLLDHDDQQHLLSVLQKRWTASEQTWNPTLGQEIELALETAGLPALAV